MSIPRTHLVRLLFGLVLATLPGCFFPMGGDPITIPVYRNDTVERSLAVTLYYDLEQTQRQEGGRPAGLVVYSLGYSACAPSALSLAEMLAARGYVFAIPNHNDLVAVCLCFPDQGGDKGAAAPAGSAAVGDSKEEETPGAPQEKGFSEEQLETYFYYRNADICTTVEHLTHTSSYPFGSLEDRPVFLVGYSLGGWNVLNVAGAGDAFPELQCEVTAVVCQNAFVGELREDQIQRITCPVFYLASTEDVLCPAIRQLYYWRPDNARMVEIVGADHYLFAVDLCASPILSAVHPDSCADSRLDVARRVNALTVEYIDALTATAEVPRIEALGSYVPDLFSIIN